MNDIGAWATIITLAMVLLGHLVAHLRGEISRSIVQKKHGKELRRLRREVAALKQASGRECSVEDEDSVDDDDDDDDDIRVMKGA